MRCLTSLALAGALGMFVIAAAQAADMAFPPMEGLPEVSQQPVELGTGWYLRGDAGWSRDHAPLLTSDLSFTSQSAVTNSYSFDFGFGYQFNNWLRADILYDYRKPQTANSGSVVWCPYQAKGLTSQVTPQNPDAIALGIYADPNETCTQQQQAKLSSQDLLLNGYIDVGTWGGVTPYIGAGGGMVRTQSNGTVNYFETANGLPYAANLTPQGNFPPQWIDIYGNPVFIGANGLPAACTTYTGPPPCPQPKVSFTQQNWNKKLTSTKYGFAWALMGGFAIDITDHLKVDLGYRYVNLGTFTGIAGGQIVKEKQSTQEIRAGFRYMIN
jgi:opacity protein-like surface antigen